MNNLINNLLTHFSPCSSTPLYYKKDISKWVVFINLSHFSMWNNPPWSTTKETLEVVSTVYAERMGSVVLYDGPGFFSTVFKMVQPLLDAKTKAKVIVTHNAKTIGSSDDLTLRTVLGKEWRALVGADCEWHTDCSPGYNHEEHWARMKEIERVNAVKSSGVPAQTHTAAAMILSEFPIAAKKIKKTPAEKAKKVLKKVFTVPFTKKKKLGKGNDDDEYVFISSDMVGEDTRDESNSKPQGTTMKPPIVKTETKKGDIADFVFGMKLGLGLVSIFVLFLSLLLVKNDFLLLKVLVM